MSLFRSKAIQLIVSVTILLQMPLAYSAVNDIFPGDYYPSQPGKTNLALYAYQRKQVGPYAKGIKQVDGQLDSTILALRLSHSFLVKDHLVALVLALPWSDTKVSPTPLADAIGKKAQGTADLRFGITTWAIYDPSNANYLGLSATIVTPSGDYNKNQLVNIGENRLKLVLSGGWQKDINKRLLFEVMPELVLYGDNKNYSGNQRLKNKPSYALTGYLRSRFTPTWHPFIGFQLNRGGESSVDGAEYDKVANSNRIVAGFSWFVANSQLILRVSKDTSMENGFKTKSDIALRFQKSF